MKSTYGILKMKVLGMLLDINMMYCYIIYASRWWYLPMVTAGTINVLLYIY